MLLFCMGCPLHTVLIHMLYFGHSGYVIISVIDIVQVITQVNISTLRATTLPKAIIMTKAHRTAISIMTEGWIVT